MLHQQPRDDSRARACRIRQPGDDLHAARSDVGRGHDPGAGRRIPQAKELARPGTASARAPVRRSYGRPVAPSVLANIERAAKSWSEGDDFTAHIHLAHTGLHALDDFANAAHRLHMAKGAMDHGASPRAVFEALRLDIDTLAKTLQPGTAARARRGTRTAVSGRAEIGPAARTQAETSPRSRRRRHKARRSSAECRSRRLPGD